jgi:hypothetical protein
MGILLATDDGDWYAPIVMIRRSVTFREIGHWTGRLCFVGNDFVLRMKPPQQDATRRIPKPVAL